MSQIGKIFHWVVLPLYKATWQVIYSEMFSTSVYCIRFLCGVFGLALKNSISTWSVDMPCTWLQLHTHYRRFGIVHRKRQTHAILEMQQWNGTKGVAYYRLDFSMTCPCRCIRAFVILSMACLQQSMECKHTFITTCSNL